MSDFVPHGVFHEFGEVGGVARQPFVRSLEDGDAVGHAEAFEDAALREGAAFVESEEGTGAGHASARQLGGGRLRLDDHREILQAAAKAGRDALESIVDEGIELGGAHRYFYS